MEQAHKHSSIHPTSVCLPVCLCKLTDSQLAIRPTAYVRKISTMRTCILGAVLGLVHEGLFTEFVAARTAAMAKEGPDDLVAEPIRKAKSPSISLPSFQSRLTEWDEQCLRFYASGGTWKPSPGLDLKACRWQGESAPPPTHSPN